MAKKTSTPKTAKRITRASIDGLPYESADIRIGDKVSFDGAWQGKPVGKRKFKVIDIDRVVIRASDGTTGVVKASALKLASE